MEEKRNNATSQRPAGFRILDTGIIPINLPKYIGLIKTEEAYAKNKKNAITVFKSDQVTITLIALQQGESIRPGSEEGEAIMSLQVIDGQLAFESMGTDVDLQTGELLTLHQQLSFKARATTDCICLLTMIK